MALLLSGLLFSIFAANVALGALSDAPFLSDVQEMLLLLSTSILFVVAILKREKDANANR